MLTLPKSSGRTEGKFNLAIAFRSLFVELGIGAKICPRLSGLRRTQETGNLQISRTEMPRVLRIEVEPELAKVTK